MLKHKLMISSQITCPHHKLILAHIKKMSTERTCTDLKQNPHPMLSSGFWEDWRRKIARAADVGGRWRMEAGWTPPWLPPAHPSSRAPAAGSPMLACSCHRLTLALARALPSPARPCSRAPIAGSPSLLLAPSRRWLALLARSRRR